MKVIFTLLLLCIGTLLFSQIKPPLFPEDVSVTDFEPDGYCNPGVANKSGSRGV